ncbi:MAG TPA: response regulator [Steroidobacteraceae bacterium]|nr:response regulator [Steroidobacteraceae bacterium]
MTAPGTVYVVDDDAAFRTAMSRMLRATGLEVQCFVSGMEFMAYLSAQASVAGAACVLVDLRMPGLDGLELQEACATSGIGLPFVFLTGQGDLPSAVSAMRLGAVDFLDKCSPRQTLLGAVQRALEEHARSHALRAEHRRLERRFAALTEREREVLGHVVQGRMNKQIAAALGIHERTVKLHRSAITTKLGVRSVAELTTLTSQAGILQEPRQPCP